MRRIGNAEAFIIHEAITSKPRQNVGQNIESKFQLYDELFSFKDAHTSTRKLVVY